MCASSCVHVGNARIGKLRVTAAGAGGTQGVLRVALLPSTLYADVWHHILHLQNDQHDIEQWI